jgi:hypothetical protein
VIAGVRWQICLLSFIWSPCSRPSGTLMTILKQMKADCKHSSDSMCCDEQLEVYAVSVARISSPLESAVILQLYMYIS